ncbi:hypothetical protein LEP1GSC043_0715 [Leptospira weilii str. Ecochallenge]|uniref:Uncharacterized protein n=1 Tax=Leptospira weilii str. Ecochallenge TaxID=1049986 RepID=N1UI59_9LEPT|nr:hypothetical protein LEP1GSC043_0715 [Leptospira weilii str. Ecochallenge]
MGQTLNLKLLIFFLLPFYISQEVKVLIVLYKLLLLNAF